jgi:diguanylate cyclase (GGDEF)-like protein/PAS domain S-box-containing protein
MPLGIAMAVTSITFAASDLVASRAEWLTLLGQSCADLVLVLDADGIITFASDRSRDLLDVSASEVVNTSLVDWVLSTDREAAEDMVLDWARQAGVRDAGVLRFVHPAGGAVELELLGNNQLRHPILGGIVVTARTVTDRHRSSGSLDESQARFVRAARGATDGLWEWDLGANRLEVSRQWLELVGLDGDGRSPSPDEWLNRVHPEDRQRLRAQIAAHLDGKTDSFEADHRVLHEDGTYRWMMCRGMAVRDGKDQPYRIAGALIDISARMLFDGLTGLPNRSFLCDRIADSLGRGGGHLFAVLLVDLDRFKVVNESLGHGAGDRLLIATSRRLETCVRPEDTIARLSADEFAILLDGLEAPEEASRIADRIRQVLSQPVCVGEQEVWCSASVGIVSSKKGYHAADDMLRDANTALHRAKKHGSARQETFETQMYLETVHRFQIERDLRSAIRNDEFHVVYQPIIDLRDGSVSGFEALVRWIHPERGFVSPVDFIPVAEDAGLVAQIDRWVLETAAQEATKWQEVGRDVVLSVNVSSKQFDLDGLVEHVTAVLEETGLPADCLKLEITESAVMDQPEAAARMLEEVQAMGVKLALDDFGTGYSSLSHLHRFPFDTVKIDRSFVSLMGEEGQDPEFVRVMLALADSLSMDAVAEGIETALQWQVLREFGARYGQGYYFARPLPAEDAERLVLSDKHW